jgi:hypothetical protein
VKLAIRQNFCFLHLPMLKCYNSTAPNWYQPSSEWHYDVSARKPRQLWFWWYAFHSDPSSDGSSTWIYADHHQRVNMDPFRNMQKTTCFNKLIAYLVWCLSCGQNLIQFATHCCPTASTVNAMCMFAEPQNSLPEKCPRELS